MRVLQTDFLGDYNLGLFANTSNKVSIIANTVPAKEVEKIAEVIGSKVFQTMISNSTIVGIFCALNSNGIVLPKIVTETEFQNIKKFANENGMSASIVESKYTALGNLILCNDRGAVVSNLLSTRDKKVIEDCLSVEVGSGTVGGLNSIGSCGIATNKGCIMHRDANDEELDNVQKILHVETDIGTANFGSPFVGSCGIASSKGVVIGERTTGPEVTRIMEALSLL